MILIQTQQQTDLLNPLHTHTPIKTAIIFVVSVCVRLCKKETPLTQQPLLQRADSLFLSISLSHTYKSKRPQGALLAALHNSFARVQSLRSAAAYVDAGAEADDDDDDDATRRRHQQPTFCGCSRNLNFKFVSCNLSESFRCVLHFLANLVWLALFITALQNNSATPASASLSSFG